MEQAGEASEPDTASEDGWILPGLSLRNRTGSHAFGDPIFAAQCPARWHLPAEGLEVMMVGVFCAPSCFVGHGGISLPGVLLSEGLLHWQE